MPRPRRPAPNSTSAPGSGTCVPPDVLPSPPVEVKLPEVPAPGLPPFDEPAEVPGEPPVELEELAGAPEPELPLVPELPRPPVPVVLALPPLVPDVPNAPLLPVEPVEP